MPAPSISGMTHLCMGMRLVVVSIGSIVSIDGGLVVCGGGSRFLQSAAVCVSCVHHLYTFLYIS